MGRLSLHVLPAMSNTATLRAWVEVRASALKANYEAVRRVTGSQSAIIPMVKADGYGLGAGRVVRALEPLGPWGWGVATVEEGVALRGFGVRRPIVVFGPLPAGTEARAAKARLTASISDEAAAERWAAAAGDGPLDFHVEIDSGMGRSGFDWREVGERTRAVKALCGPNLRWTGIYTHFHSADVADAGAARTQWRRFRDALSQLPVSAEDLLVHASNSAAALRWPEFAADAVRPGIFLYGGRAVEADVGDVARPEPAVAVRSRLVRIREASPGTTSGYGATYAARGWERWGTLSIGYGDGLPRSLGNVGHALIRGRRVPIVGRISMDMTVVDISPVSDVQIGDEATLIGRAGENEIALDDVAAHAGTISYEILTGLTARLPRVEC
jgi:alanine racemase